MGASRRCTAMGERAGDWRTVGLPMATGAASLDHHRTLHVRCGSDIHHALTEAGFTGRFLEFSDPYCQGPVRRLARDAFIDERAAFLDAAYGEDGMSHRDRLAAEYDDLDRAGLFERVILWFEHDTYDQLILARVLSTLPGVVGDVPIELICVDEVPGVDRFIGLGQLAPAQLVELWHRHRREVTSADIETARAAFDALCDSDPTRLAGIAYRTDSPVPIMTRALRRHLEELPGAIDGLGLTQRLVLEIVDAEGPLTAGQAFRTLMMERETLPFLGDLMFWYVLRDVMATREPVLRLDADSRDQSWPRKKLSIARAGRCILGGEMDYLDLYEASRWVGGVKVTGHGTPPRWDRESERLVPTPG